MDYQTITQKSHESQAQFIIRQAFLKEVGEAVAESAYEWLEAEYETPEALNELKEAYESDDVWRLDALEGVCQRAAEAVYHLDTYYSQTKSRGDVEDVWDVMCEILEDYGCEYLVGELFAKDINEPLLHKANRLVNVTAEVIAHSCAQWAMYENIQRLFAANEIEVTEP